MDRYDQIMLCEMIGKKEDQIVMVELKFDNGKRAELDKIAERLGTTTKKFTVRNQSRKRVSERKVKGPPVVYLCRLLIFPGRRA